MLEEGGEGLVFLHGARELGEVFEAAGAFRAAVRLEHRGVAAFVEHDAGELGWGSSFDICFQRWMSATKRPKVDRARA